MNKIEFRSGNSEYEFIKEHIEKELYTNKKIICYVDSLPPENIKKKNDEIWVFIQVESYYILSHIYSEVKNYPFDVFLMFTTCVNRPGFYKFFPYNKVYWIKPGYHFIKNLNLPNLSPIKYLPRDKKLFVSMLCGEKNWAPGHQFRRKIWDYQKNMTFPKKFRYSQNYGDLKLFDDNKKISHSKDKTELFIDSMFHIAIENNQATDYFTEKLIDCFVSMTIPIYYGCPNIGDYFDIRGMIIVNDMNDINNLNNIISEKFYKDRITFIEDNYCRVLNRPSFKEQFIQIMNKKYEINIEER
jgi:hypothetical protein